MNKEAVIFGEEKIVTELAEMLKEKGLTTAKVSFDEKDNVYDLVVSKEERQNALIHIQTFLKEKEETMLKNMSEEEKKERQKKAMEASGVYQKQADKAADAKSSGMSLLIVGIIGLVLIVLYLLGFIPIRLSAFGKIVTVAVMGFLCISFIVFGLHSMKSWKKLEVFVKEEDRLTEEIEKWYKKDLTKEMVEEGLFPQGSENLMEEEKYFHRIAKIKFFINRKFMNLDRAFVEEIAENIYQDLYE